VHKFFLGFSETEESIQKVAYGVNLISKQKPHKDPWYSQKPSNASQGEPEFF
jgi:hypothetical protein